MSDASASARPSEIFIGNDEATDFTTKQWHEAIGTAARTEYRTLRTRALRLTLIPLVFLALHFVLVSFDLPVIVVASSMAFVLIPLFYFRDLMKDVADANTADGMTERFDLYTYDSRDKVLPISRDDFKRLLGKHFTSKDLKKKQRASAAEKFLSVNTSKQKFLMWAAVIAHVVALVVLSGPFYGLAFATTYVLATVATVRYFHKATRQIRVLSGFLSHDPAPEVDDTEPKHSKKSTKPGKSEADDTTDEMYGPSNEELLQMITAYNDKKSMDPGDRQFLELFFGGNVPKTKEFKAMLAETPDTTSDPAPEADDTTGRAPLPRRTKKTVAAPQSGPTGTPAHGIPAVTDNRVLSAPLPQAVPPTDSSVPADIKNLLDMYHNGWPLEDADMDRIQPYLNGR